MNKSEIAERKRLVPITSENSTVDGHDWLMEGLDERFSALDFTGQLFIDDSYMEGCLKYVPCGMDDDPTCGHRIRSKFKRAKPIKRHGKWMWQVLDSERRKAITPEQYREELEKWRQNQKTE